MLCNSTGQFLSVLIIRALYYWMSILGIGAPDCWKLAYVSYSQPKGHGSYRRYCSWSHARTAVKGPESILLVSLPPDQLPVATHAGTTSTRRNRGRAFGQEEECGAFWTAVHGCLRKFYTHGSVGRRGRLPGRTHTYTYVCVHIHTYIYIYICSYVHVCTFIYIYM